MFCFRFFYRFFAFVSHNLLFDGTYLEHVLSKHSHILDGIKMVIIQIPLWISMAVNHCWYV